MFKTIVSIIALMAMCQITFAQGFNLTPTAATATDSVTNPLSALEKFTQSVIYFGATYGDLDMLTTSTKSITPNPTGFTAVDTTKLGVVVYEFVAVGKGSVEVEVTIPANDGTPAESLKLTYGGTATTTATAVKADTTTTGKMTPNEALTRAQKAVTTGNGWTDHPTFKQKKVNGNSMQTKVVGDNGSYDEIYSIQVVDGMWIWSIANQDGGQVVHRMESDIPAADAATITVTFTEGPISGAKMVITLEKSSAPAPVTNDNGNSNGSQRRVPAPARGSGGQR